MTRNFYRPASSAQNVVPGTPPAWPVQIYALLDGQADPDDKTLIGPKTDKEMEEIFAGLQKEYDSGASLRDPYIEAAHLPGWKAQRLAEIDERTRLVIARGFVFKDKVLSLSANAQTNLIELEAQANLEDYPMAWNCLDDMEEPVALKDASEAAAMCAVGTETKKVARVSGSLLKNRVRAAATKAELDAIVDER